MATYRKTDTGSLKILQNRISSKRTRRLHKIARVQNKIDGYKKKEEDGKITATDQQDLVRQEFELNQAQADVEQLQEELVAIADRIKQSKNSRPDEEPLEVGVEQPLDEYLHLLGMNPQVVDEQEVQLSEL